eukprot:CAMPEP_0204275992 /NCGR_PEP_ID=MMETSP0468-20130131/27128_1 /ASSEMBLY_ACC=CAM_ASM_000383 /TAXON_ID=2969 /ORGANISM="Oxyrrhis marina" /LENGTH=92 /DNA_ID=CAMNT_0051252471 /DNA_START=49 /DNA_END=324 /DNA_ORIENTATION=-
MHRIATKLTLAHCQGESPPPEAVCASGAVCSTPQLCTRLRKKSYAALPRAAPQKGVPLRKLATSHVMTTTTYTSVAAAGSRGLRRPLRGLVP